MAVLVTGVAGFIGAGVAHALLAQGRSIIGIDNLNDYYDPALKRARLARLTDPAFTFHKVDFANHHALLSALDDTAIDAIIHLGAQAGVRYSLANPRAFIEANITGHFNLLELARERVVAHMVYASSSSVYGGSATQPFSLADRADRPLSLYAATKRANELISESYAHLHRLPLTGLRFFTVYGPWGRPDMAMWQFTERILAGCPITVFNEGRMRRDFTYIDDIVAGVLACLARPPKDDGSAKPGGSTTPHHLYNIGNNRPEALLDMIDLIAAACGRPATLDFQPMPPGDVPETCAEIADIVRDTGFRPETTLAVGVPKFVDWYRAYCAAG